jgi:hypothetical protein
MAPQCEEDDEALVLTGLHGNRHSIVASDVTNCPPCNEACKEERCSVVDYNIKYYKCWKPLYMQYDISTSLNSKTVSRERWKLFRL